MLVARTPSILLYALILAAAAAPRAEAMQSGVEAVNKVESITRFLNERPHARFVYEGNRIDRVYGGSLATGPSPWHTAHAFRQNHAGIWGVAADELQEVGPFADGAHIVPIMFNPATGQYKFTGVYYTQQRGGVPVFRSKLILLVRNEANFPLVLASSSLRELDGFDVAAARAAAANSGAASREVRRMVGAHAEIVEGDLQIWAGVDAEHLAPRLVRTFTTETVGAPVEKYQKWLILADALTGDIVFQESQIHQVDITGSVSGMATTGYAADACATEIATPLPYAQVSNGLTTVYTDANGQFVLPNAGGTPVNVTSTISGQYFQVANWNGTGSAGPPTGIVQNVNPPGPANFLHNAANASEFNRAEVNAYIHANIVRDYVLEFHPTYPAVASQSIFPINVNRNQTCNAFYLDNAINFYIQGGGCTNTANSTIVYHEYGHHLVAAAGSGQGAYGEGMSDCIAMLVADDPCLANGYQTCGTCLRSAINSCQYQSSGCSSCGTTIHACGTVLSGCVWDARTNLQSTHPATYREIISALTINSILLHSGSSITPSITVDFLVLDDDDSEIANGTPHYEQINTAFTAHNMPGPALTIMTFEFPNGRPSVISPDGTTTMRVHVVPLTGAPQPGTGMLHIDSGSGFTAIPMVSVSPNVYDAVFPSLPCGTQLTYYVSALSISGTQVMYPTTAPSDAIHAVSAVSVATVFNDSFESAQGWTVVNSPGLITGLWQQVVPHPACAVRAAPPSDGDGSGFCFVTQNTAPPNPPTMNECDLDVDGGSTTLKSPILDATADVPMLTYRRWFTNFIPGNSETQQDDTLRVEFSIDGGLVWRELETVGPGTASPVPVVLNTWITRTFNMNTVPGFGPTTQFRLRFIASDIGNSSAVEAAIDGVRLDGYSCKVTCFADIDGNGAVGVPDLLAVIGSWGPCSGCAADLNDDAAVGVPDLLLLINSWGPCE